MGLFDLFSNDTATTAAGQRNAGLAAGIGFLQGNYGQGRDALSGNLQQGRDALTTGYGKTGDIYSGLGNYYSGLYGGGAQAYGDATGANGAAGFGRAQTNFRTDPGYGFQMDQGLQGLQRTHAAAGNLSSGNADADTLKFSQGLADQSYGNYVSRLAPYLGLAGSGAATAAAGQAGAATGLGTGLNASYGAQGAGLNASYQGEGAAANAAATGVGASNAAATMNNYNVGANQLSALAAGGKLFGSLFGSFGGAGGAGAGGGGSSGSSFLPSSSFLFGNPSFAP